MEKTPKMLHFPLSAPSSLLCSTWICLGRGGFHTPWCNCWLQQFYIYIDMLYIARKAFLFLLLSPSYSASSLLIPLPYPFLFFLFIPLYSSSLSLLVPSPLSLNLSSFVSSMAHLWLPHSEVDFWPGNAFPAP